MSGKSLYPLSISLAERVEKAFDGKAPRVLFGGADQYNIADIFACGVWPITHGNHAPQARRIQPPPAHRRHPRRHAVPAL